MHGLIYKLVYSKKNSIHLNIKKVLIRDLVKSHFLLNIVLIFAVWISCGSLIYSNSAFCEFTEKKYFQCKWLNAWVHDRFYRL